MLTNTTAEKLREMHLSIMAGAFTRQIDDGSMKELPFEDRFGLIVDAEWATRKSNLIAKSRRPLMSLSSVALPCLRAKAFSA